MTALTMPSFGIDNRKVCIVFLSISGISSIVIAMILSTFPAQPSSVVTQQPMPVARATMPAFDLNESLSKLNDMVNQAEAKNLSSYGIYSAKKVPIAGVVVGDGSIVKSYATRPPGLPYDPNRPATHMILEAAQKLDPHTLYELGQEIKNDPTWLGSFYDLGGYKRVFAGEWITCQHIEPNLNYRGAGTEPSLEQWNLLSQELKIAVINECNTYR